MTNVLDSAFAVCTEHEQASLSALYSISVLPLSMCGLVNRQTHCVNLSVNWQGSVVLWSCRVFDMVYDGCSGSRVDLHQQWR